MKKIVILATFILLFNGVISNSYSYDLWVRWVKVDRNFVIEGEIVEIEARIENNGSSHPLNVYFYIDSIDSNHLIGMKSYDSINKYRLPKIEFDTKGYEGRHKIIVAVYDENPSNNFAYCNITILKTTHKEKILIKEIYYHTHPGIKNEFLCIYNCGNETWLNGFYLTTQPWKRADKQNKIFLPDIKMKKGKKIYITQNGSAFLKETGFNASYEYYDCSPIPNLKRKGNFVMANEGGAICLKDAANNTIDCVVYGNFSFHDGWEGDAIPNVESGFVLRRNDCIDTNRSKDWNWNHKIGQTDFSPFHFKANKAITFCSPDCSYEVVSDALNGRNISINVYMFTHPYLYKILKSSNANIKILLDGNVIGGIPLEERYIAWKLENKAEIRYMFGNEEEKIYKRYKFDHAKYAIIDNKCIIESANWVMNGLPVSNTYGNREWGILIENENLSNFLLNLFSQDFNPNMKDSILFNERDFLKGKPSNFSINYFIPKGSYKPKFKPFKINEEFNATIILSPDNAEEEILSLIKSAKNEILIEQAYIQKKWGEEINPFLKELIERKKNGIDIKVILNYNPRYKSTNKMNEETCKYLKENGIKVRYSNISIHNKGMIVDNRVLISSINWGENSVRNNREIGIIIEDENITNYFKKIFYYDWNYESMKNENKYNKIFIAFLFIATFLIIYFYRRRK